MDNRFTVWFSYHFATCGPGCQSAFVLSQELDKTHVPQTQTWNSALSVNSILFLGKGRYRVTLHELNDDVGNPQVTAFGTNANYCKLQEWLRINENVELDVNCYDTFGEPANSLFSLLYMSHVNMTEDGTAQPWSRTYALADQETSDAWYKPIEKYQWNQRWRNREDVSARRLSRGRYAVRFYDYPDRNSTNAIVTAHGGTEATYCKPEIWTSYGEGTELIVNCYRPDGSKVNSEFSAVYTYYPR